MRYLLDTNALSHVVRYPQSGVGRRLGALPESTVFTSIIVACELRYGAAKKGSATLRNRVEELLASIEVEALESGVDRIYAEIRERLESRGHTIGAHDLLIAAHALERNATLVTDNVGEFTRVPGLKVENWVR